MSANEQERAMQRIWAPWRIDYVRQTDNANACFLCEAARADQDKERLVLWRSRSCLCIMNRWPYNNGHLLVAPLEHKAALADLTEAEVLDQFQMLRRCQANLTEALQPAGFNVGLNLGRVAGAGVADHIHWHIVPRWPGDTNFMPVLGATKVIAQSLETLWELLRRVDQTRGGAGEEGGSC